MSARFSIDSYCEEREPSIDQNCNFFEIQMTTNQLTYLFFLSLAASWGWLNRSMLVFPSKITSPATISTTISKISKLEKSSRSPENKKYIGQAYCPPKGDKKRKPCVTSGVHLLRHTCVTTLRVLASFRPMFWLDKTEPETQRMLQLNTYPD